MHWSRHILFFTCTVTYVFGNSSTRWRWQEVASCKFLNLQLQMWEKGKALLYHVSQWSLTPPLTQSVTIGSSSHNPVDDKYPIFRCSSFLSHWQKVRCDNVVCDSDISMHNASTPHLIGMRRDALICGQWSWLCSHPQQSKHNFSNALAGAHLQDYQQKVLNVENHTSQAHTFPFFFYLYV